MALSDQTFLNPSPQAKEDLNARLETLWQRNLPVLSGRLDLLSAAAAAAEAHALGEPFRAEAAAIAHKLAGSLGMFGYPDGTHLALRLETAFKDLSASPETLVYLAEQLRITLHQALR